MPFNSFFDITLVLSMISLRIWYNSLISLLFVFLQRYSSSISIFLSLYKLFVKILLDNSLYVFFWFFKTLFKVFPLFILRYLLSLNFIKFLRFFWAYVSNSWKIEYNLARSFNLEEYLLIFKINSGMRSFAVLSIGDEIWLCLDKMFLLLYFSCFIKF